MGMPRIDGVEDATDVSAGQRGFINAVNAAWKGPRAAEVRMLPEELSLRQSLPEITNDGVDRTIPYGIDVLELEPVVLDPMSSFERKVVHDAVKAAGLSSESEGAEPRRCVVILPQ